MVKYIFDIPKEMDDKIQDLVRRTGLTKTAVAKIAIDTYIKKEE